MAKIVYISDADPRGSGYQGIGVSLCSGLANLGNNIYYIGLNYHGEENEFLFHLLPARNFAEVIATFHNLVNLWRPDALVVAMDIPVHGQLLPKLLEYKVPYLGITPLESDPLCFTWATFLMQMKKVFFISKFGTDEARKAGVNAQHLPIGIDSKAWKIPTQEEKAKLRLSFLGVDDPRTFVILTVADNQERKNLSAAMQIVSEFKKSVTNNFRYILVTREHSGVGWELRDLARTLNINQELMIFERGIPFKNLWGLYASSDVFLLTSKGEGYCAPVLEAMSCGVPVVASRAGALIEHLSNGRGWLIEPKFIHIDTFGNANRYYIDIADGLIKLSDVYLGGQKVEDAKRLSREYAESRTWEEAITLLDSTIWSILNEQTQQEKVFRIQSEPEPIPWDFS